MNICSLFIHSFSPDISIDGDTNVAFTENVEQRFLSYGWQVLHVDDGDSDLDAIYNAIAEARKEKSKPTIIRLRTTIGYGSKQQGTHGVHGARELLDSNLRVTFHITIWRLHSFEGR